MLVAVVAFGEEIDTKTGRFRLFVAEISHANGQKASTLFRIDSATGEVWRFDENLFSIGTNQVFVTGWTKIPEDFDAQYARAVAAVLPVNLARTNASPRVSK